MNIILAILIIVFSGYSLFRFRENIPMAILLIIIFFFNYSICVGEYITQTMQIDLFDSLRVGSKNYFTTGLFVLFLYTMFFSLFLKNKKTDYVFEYKNFTSVYILFVLLLLYIFFMEIDRSFSFEYEVKISSFYEYSYIFFIFLFKYSDTRIKKICTISFLVLFILQDAYYGGRATSIQLLLVFCMCFFYKYLSIKKILILFFVGLLLFNVIGAYRANYSLTNNLISNAVEHLKIHWFVQDTAVYAYSASITHLYAADIVSWNTRISSFISGLLSIILGSSSLDAISGFLPDAEANINLTHYVTKYHVNVGGGVFPSYFYFWLGWTGVIISGVLTGKYISYWYRRSTNSELFSLIFIGIICASPRWYLYNPVLLFRGPLIIIPLVYIMVKLYKKVIVSFSKRSGVNI